MTRFFFRLVLAVTALFMIGIGVAASTRNRHVLAYIEYLSGPYITRVVLTDVDRGLTVPLHAVASDTLSWSLDGQSLLFTAKPSPEDAAQIHTMQVFDRTVRPLGMGIAPAWSPDGRQIAFASGQMDDGTIYLVDADGSDLHWWVDLSDTILEDAYWIHHLHWSPDGHWIELETNSMEASVGLYLVDVTTAAARRLTTGWLASWSPDSTSLVYQIEPSGASDIYTLNIETGARHFLSENLVYASYPVWSPDGDYLAFVCMPEPTRSLVTEEICIVDSEGENLRFISTPLSVIENVAWSPDGERLAISGRDIANEGFYTSYDIYVVNADGSGLRRIVDGPPANAAQTYSYYFSLAWQP